MLVEDFEDIRLGLYFVGSIAVHIELVGSI